jgi:hypothetical protein
MKEAPGSSETSVHGVTTQKTPFFIVTAVKTSNLTCLKDVLANPRSTYSPGCRPLIQGTQHHIMIWMKDAEWILKEVASLTDILPHHVLVRTVGGWRSSPTITNIATYI